MKPLAAVVSLVVAFAIGALAAWQAPSHQPPNERESREIGGVQFRAIDIFIDSKDRPLAAYQLEFKASKGEVKIVGIEGGEDEKFRKPPYYDPQAMQQERVIIAAFSTADMATLPRGRTRIATIHVQATGDVEPAFAITPSLVATTQGQKIDAEVTWKPQQN